MQGFRLLVAAPILTVVVVVMVTDVGFWFKVVAVVFGVVLPAALDGAPACLGIENKTAAGAKVVLVSNVLTQLAVLVAVLVIAQADVVWAVRLIMISITVLLSPHPDPPGLPTRGPASPLPSGPARGLLAVRPTDRTRRPVVDAGVSRGPRSSR